MTAQGSARSWVPPGSVEYVMEVLKGEKAPMKRRRILEELERRGHRISLAGLNRVLEVCSEEKRIVNGPDGVKATPGIESAQRGVGHVSQPTSVIA